MDTKKIIERLNELEARLNNLDGIPPYKLFTKVEGGYIAGVVYPGDKGEVISKAEFKKIPGIKLIVVYEDKKNTLL